MLKNILNHKKRKANKLDGYRFNIDIVNQSTIAGWAKKVDSDESTMTIDIRSDNVILYRCKANLDRPDLKEAGIGNGKYGFNITPSDLKLEKDIQGIDIFINGNKANSSLLPLKLTVSQATQVQEIGAVRPQSNVSKYPEKSPENLPDVNNIEMVLDGYSIAKVFGWARLKSSGAHRCNIELKTGEVVIGSDKADKFRRSLKAKNIGDGRHAFHIVPQLHLFPSAKIYCNLFVDGLKADAKPIILETDEKTLEEAKFANNFSDEIKDFNTSVNKELALLSKEVSNDGSNSMQVAMQNIALLSARIGVIEHVLTKHFSQK